MRLNDLIEADHRWTGRLSVAERPGALRSLAAVLAHSGDSWFWLMGLGVVWLLGGDPWRRWAAFVAAAVLVTAALVMGLKFSIRRRRPEGAWGAIYRKTDPHSFPSGHAARATLLAVLFSAWGPAWLTAYVLAWAPLVILARVAMGLHYLSDVVAGAGLGLLCGLIAVLVVPI